MADQHPLVREQICNAITTAFVLSAVPDADAGQPPPRPRIVKRVLDEMHDDPARPWTASDMAEIAGVSVRRLQEGFRHYVGASPRECLTDIRLARVRGDLLRGTDLQDKLQVLLIANIEIDVGDGNVAERVFRDKKGVMTRSQERENYVSSLAAGGSLFLIGADIVDHNGGPLNNSARGIGNRERECG